MHFDGILHATQRVTRSARVGMAAAALLLALAGGAGAATLSSPRAVRDLTRAQADLEQPVSFQAAVTSWQSPATFVLQSSGVGVRVLSLEDLRFAPGDVVSVQGSTRWDASPYVQASSLHLVRHGLLPQAAPASFEQLLQSNYNHRLVSVRGLLLAADPISVDDARETLLQIRMGSNGISALVPEDHAEKLKANIGAEIVATGVASGRDESRLRNTAALLRLSSAAEIERLGPSPASPWTLPQLPFQDLVQAYHGKERADRVRVRGAVTFSQQGRALVLQEGSRSLWVFTRSPLPVQLGEVVEAAGWPDDLHGRIVLKYAELRSTHEIRPALPIRSSWRDLLAPVEANRLVSLEGRLVGAMRGLTQDEFVLATQDGLFSAYLQHPANPNGAHVDLVSSLQPGSQLRVTGISAPEGDQPFEAHTRFSILMRSTKDLDVLSRPSWFTARRLAILSGFLATILLASALWGALLSRRVKDKTALLARRIEADAAFERRMKQLEARRSRILEGINGSAPLAELLEEICDLVSMHLAGAPCWCEVADGARIGKGYLPLHGSRLVSRPIPARNGQSLGRLVAAFKPDSQPSPGEQQALSIGVEVATLAIETRRLYSDLRRRSEFDLLTDVPNRFSFKLQMDKQIEEARRHAQILGVIYIDLDDFKLINDIHGHPVGDLYLQEVAARMKRQLRGQDMLARIGGDEFAVLVPLVRSREELSEIAQRLELSFHEPLLIDGAVLCGSASVGMAIYPEDAATCEGLLTAADAAMYVEKHTRRKLTMKKTRRKPPSPLEHS